LIPRHPWWLALRTAAAVATGISAFYAFSVLPLAQVYAIIFASPLMITILAAVLVGLAGVMVVLQPGTTELTLGHAAALTVAVSGAIAAIV